MSLKPYGKESFLGVVSFSEVQLRSSGLVLDRLTSEEGRGTGGGEKGTGGGREGGRETNIS